MKITIGGNKQNHKMKFIDILFVFFCLFPFILPNPIVTTNIQPYAAMLGTLVILSELLVLNHYRIRIGRVYFFGATWFALVVAVFILIISGISITALRALFNYYSVAVIPLAAYFVVRRLGYYPERFIKTLILLWFAVSSFQFFIDRSFLTGIIGGVRFSYSYRGVVGLASEPSFLGIACFYFLHMAKKFQKHRMTFILLILIMGILYAQSMIGTLFIGGFMAIYVLDATNTKRGMYIWIASALAVIVFIYLLNTVLSGTRLHQLYTLFMREGIEGLMTDVSAENRFEAITGAIQASLGNNLLPLGFSERIGSGYGGFLCELGFFSLPVLAAISYVMALTFHKRLSRVLYFVVVTMLLFNNTQIGNPLLLFVLAMNLVAPYIDYRSQHSEKRER